MAAPKLDRNRRIARAAINGDTIRALGRKYKLSSQTIRDAIQCALNHDAPEFKGWGLKDLRAHAEDVLPLLMGEKVTPENRADLLDAASDPFATLEKAAKACGLNPVVTKRLVQRLQKFQPVIDATRDIKTETLQKLLDEKAYLALSYMDEVSFGKATLGDLAKTAGILIDKRQLLNGEPTQIMSSTDRKSMDELVAKVMQVAQKRGLVDLDPSQFKRVN